MPKSPRKKPTEKSTEKPDLNPVFFNTKHPHYPIQPIKNLLPRVQYGKVLPTQYKNEFPNAKPTAMLERGLVKSTDVLKPGDKGVLVIDDGNMTEVEVASVNLIHEYNFRYGKDKFYTKDDTTRDGEWDFYTHTEPKPFVPRKGGSKRRKTMKKKRSS